MAIESYVRGLCLLISSRRVFVLGNNDGVVDVSSRRVHAIDSHVSYRGIALLRL